MVNEEKDSGMLGLIIAVLILAVLAWLWLQQRITEISTEDAERSLADAEKKAEDLQEAARSQLGSVKRAVPIHTSEPETTPEVPQPPSVATPEPSLASSDTALVEAAQTPEASSGDDLQRIEGIGPKYEEILVAAGIITYAQIAHMSEDQILDVIRAGGGRKSASMSTWAEQAALAAKGDWEALAILQAKLSGGRREE